MIRLLWIARAALLVSILTFATPFVLLSLGVGYVELFFVISLFAGYAIYLGAAACVILQIAIYIQRQRSST